MPKSSNTSRLIVIEGLDGSGKATQAGLLAESLTAAGTPVRRISFPDYAHKSSIPVQMYLNGEIGSLEEVNVYAASTFYSIDRYISYQTDWNRDCKEGRLSWRTGTPPPMPAIRWSSSLRRSGMAIWTGWRIWNTPAWDCQNRDW